MEEALRLYMIGQADVTAIFGSDPFRWYALTIPQNAAFPAVVAETQSVDRSDAYCQDGDSSFCKRTIELTIAAKTYTQARNGWNAIRKAVKKFHKVNANGIVGSMVGVPVQSITITSETDDYVPAEDAKAVGHFLVATTLEILHLEDDN